MNNNIIEKKLYPKAINDDFRVGDAIKVYQKIKEGSKERIQMFSGIVICKKGVGIQKTFTVRRVYQGIGTEKIFPLYSPTISEIIIDRKSLPTKARLYSIRKLKGKKANKVKTKKV